MRNPRDREDFLLGVADEARGTLVSNLIQEVDNLVTNAGVPKADEDLINKCLKSFRCLSPAEGMSAISEVLNAAWLSAKTKSFYFDPMHEEQKLSLISELVWKSIEVFEIEQRLKLQNST